MIEIKRKDSIELNKYYVLRGDVLYETDIWDIAIGETYCIITEAYGDIHGNSKVYKAQRGNSPTVFFALDPEMNIVDFRDMIQRNIKKYLQGSVDFLVLNDVYLGHI